MSISRVLSTLFSSNTKPRVAYTCNLCRTVTLSPALCDGCGLAFCSSACFRAHLTPVGCSARVHRTPCRHVGWMGCAERATLSTVRGFAVGYGLKAATAAAIVGITKRSLTRALAAVTSWDTIRFGAFMAGLLGASSGVHCCMAHARGTDDWINRAVAGAVGGAMLQLDTPSRRPSIAVYILCRALFAGWRSLERSKAVPADIPFDSLMFGACNAPIMYGFLLDPSILDPSYHNWILRMGDLRDFSLEWSLRLPRALMAAHPGKYTVRDTFVSCNTMYHPHSCLTAHVLDWVKCLGRGARVYTPVHALPLLLFKPSLLTSDPAGTSKRLTKAVSLSCLFIASYVFTVKSTMCMLRTLRLRDDWWHPVVAGSLTGFSLLLEQRKRRTELVIYVASHAVKALWRLAVQAKLARNVSWGPSLVMAVAMSMILGLDRKNFKPTFQSVLRILFGDRAGAHRN